MAGISTAARRGRGKNREKDPVSQDRGAAERAEEMFQLYLDMERPRSIRRLKASLDRRKVKNVPSLTTLLRYSTTYSWDRRAAEEDAKTAYELNEKRRRERLADMERRESRVLTQADVIMDSATGVFFDLQARQPIPFSAIAPEQQRAALAAIKTMREIERLELGQATSRPEHTGPDGEPLPTGATSTQIVVFGPEALEAMERFLIGPDADPPRAKIPVKRLGTRDTPAPTVIDADEGIILE